MSRLTWPGDLVLWSVRHEVHCRVTADVSTSAFAGVAFRLGLPLQPT
jgi:hypothetical protein